MLTPTALTRDETLVFLTVIPLEHLPVDAIQAAYEAAAVGPATVEYDRHGRMMVKTADAPGIEIWHHDYLARRLDDECLVAALDDALALPPVTGLAVARDTQPVEVRAPDPRAYAIAATALGRDEPVWAERGEFAVRMVRERWPEKFDEEMASAVEAASGDWGQSLLR